MFVKRAHRFSAPTHVCEESARHIIEDEEEDEDETK